LRGKPAEVLAVEECELPPLRPTEVLVKTLFAPIHPSDINMIEGVYLYNPTPPSVPGGEGVSEIVEVGEEVKEHKKGAIVINTYARIGREVQLGSWCSHRIIDEKHLFAIPREPKPDLQQLAMLIVNPCTAYRMLSEFVNLQPGDYVIQNAANSAVGVCVIQQARARGIKTINVVRRKELIPVLQELGADVVVTDEIPLSQQVKELTGGAEIPLALNAVGGESAKELAKSLSAHGYHVTYGAMGREPLSIANSLLIFKDIHFVGFGNTRKQGQMTREEWREMLNYLLDLVVSGKLRMPVHQTYPFTKAKEAVEHAFADSRNGKILFSNVDH